VRAVHHQCLRGADELGTTTGHHRDHAGHLKGAAAVSGGSFLVFAATVTAIGVLPVEGLALLFGVHRFKSLAIATCNTIGNSVATVVVSKWSGEFTEQTARAEHHRVWPQPRGSAPIIHSCPAVVVKTVHDEGPAKGPFLYSLQKLDQLSLRQWAPF